MKQLSYSVDITEVFSHKGNTHAYILDTLVLQQLRFYKMFIYYNRSPKQWNKKI